MDCSADHAFKAEVIPQIRRLLAGEILSGDFKADAVSLRIGIRHRRNRLLWKLCHVLCHFQLILRDIGAIAVQIAHILQLAIHDNIHIVTVCGIYHAADVSLLIPVRIVAHMPVENVPDLLTCGKLSLLRKRIGKGGINLEEQLHSDNNILKPSLVYGRNQIAHSDVEMAQLCAVLLPEPAHRISRIAVALLVVFRQYIRIERLVPLLQLCELCLFQTVLRQKSPRLIQQQEKPCRAVKVIL